MRPPPPPVPAPATLLGIHNNATLGKISCNLFIHDIDKGHLVRTINALNGVSSSIQAISRMHPQLIDKDALQVINVVEAEVEQQQQPEAGAVALGARRDPRQQY